MSERIKSISHISIHGGAYFHIQQSHNLVLILICNLSELCFCSLPTVEIKIFGTKEKDVTLFFKRKIA